MTGRLPSQQNDSVLAGLAELETALALMQPLLKQMHLLSSNAVSAAARAGSEGDAFRVLTHVIQELGQEIHQDRQRIEQHIHLCQSFKTQSERRRGLNQLEVMLSVMPQAVKKGEYLAICASVEAAHTENHGDSFNAVADMLKHLVQSLREQVNQQQRLLQSLLSTDC
jgi:methyl-accepting chemotaxis protein